LGQLQNYILLLITKFKTHMPKFPNCCAFLALQLRSKGIEIQGSDESIDSSLICTNVGDAVRNQETDLIVNIWIACV